MTSKYALTPQLYNEELAHFEKMLEELPDGAKITEWGSGGSTTMFADHLKPNQRLVSVEHNPEWFNRVCRALKNHEKKDQIAYFYVDLIINAEKKGVKSRLDYRFWEYGDPPEENPIFLHQYINPNVGVPNLDVWDSSVYFVDGIARGACLATIYMKAKNREASVYIHDYVGREHWYAWAAEQYSKKEIIGDTLCKLSF